MSSRPTPVFPAAVAGDSQLMIATNRVQTRLVLPLTATATQMTVEDATRITAFSLLTLDRDGEIVKVLAAPAGNVITVQRGFDGTTAVTHLASSTVSGFVDAWHTNVLGSEIIAIQQTLGPNLSNVPGSTTFQAGSFDFVAQTPGGSLSVGLNVVPLAPVPRGINGSNTKHYLYISGGTGAAEAVLIGGGTAVSGAASGTVIVTCANAHSGSWTIQSATKGIQEAEKMLPPEGGVVVMGSGNLQMRAPISYRPNETFQGLGPATRLIPASSSAVVFDDNVPAHGVDPYHVVVDNISFSDFTIDGQSYPGANSVIGIRNLAKNPNEIYSIIGVRVSNISFNNIRSATLFQRVFDVSLTGVRCYGNTQIRFEDTTLDTAHHNNVIFIENFNYEWRLMDATTGAAPVLAGEAAIKFVHAELAYVVNSIFDLAGGVNGMDGIGFFGGGEDLSLVNLSMLNARYAVALRSTAFGGTNYYPGYVRILNVSVDSPWSGAVIADDATVSAPGLCVANVSINNCFFTNPSAGSTNVTMVNIGQHSRYWSICNTQISGLTAAFPQTGIVVGANSDYIQLNGNQIGNPVSGPPGGHGIFVGSSAGVFGLETTIFYGLTDGINDASATVAASATLTLPKGRRTVIVSGSAAITAITANTAEDNQQATLIFNSAGSTVTAGATILLSGGTFTATAFSTLTLQYVAGTYWVETARSIK